MERERWQEIDALFCEALALPPEQREKLLARVCHDDPDKHAAVQELLAADAEAEGLLDEPLADEVFGLLQASCTTSAITGGARGEPLTLAPGEQIDHFEIQQLLGAGGSGEVYLARDSQLGRQVALKVIRTGAPVSGDAQRRFLREAQITAMFNHPHIITIYEVGESHGYPYLALEYLQGETLEHRLARQQASLPEILRLGLAVAEALEEAHQHNVLHRDLKPANIFLTSSGAIRVLDFGIAACREHLAADQGEHGSASADGSTSATADGMSNWWAGTPFYMAPEQWQGAPCSTATDIWALGMLLLEMVAGEHPFRDCNLLEIQERACMSVPVSSEITAAVPLQLQELIERCLSPAQEQRPSAPEVRTALLHLAETLPIETAVVAAADPDHPDRNQADWAPAVSTGPAQAGRWQAALRSWPLRLTILLVVASVVVAAAVWWPRGEAPPAGAWVAGSPATTTVTSLGVLPLAHRIPHATGGFAERLTTALRETLAASGSMRIESPPPDVVDPDIGTLQPGPVRALGVDAVLKGSVAPTANQVLVVLRVIDARSGQPILGRSFSGERATIDQELREVAGAMAEQLTTIPLVDLANSDATGVLPTAEEAFMKGQALLARQTYLASLQAMEYFDDALLRDPQNADAITGIASAYLNLWMTGSGMHCLDQARRAATRALTIEPNHARALLVQAAIAATFDLDAATSERCYRQVLELQPANASAHARFASLLAGQGRFDEAEAHARRAGELEPLSAGANLVLAWVHYFAGRYDEAIAVSDRTITLDPGYPGPHGTRALAAVELGRYDEAIESATTMARLGGYPPEESPEVGYIFGRAGRLDRAKAVFADCERDPVRLKVSDSFSCALIAVGLGELDRAMAWLEQAEEERVWMAQLAVDPRLPACMTGRVSTSCWPGSACRRSTPRSTRPADTPTGER